MNASTWVFIAIIAAVVLIAGYVAWAIGQWGDHQVETIAKMYPEPGDHTRK